MARATMADLIAQLRVLADDTSTTDDLLQATLDRYSIRLAGVALTTGADRLIWASRYPNLEADAALYDQAYTAAIPFASANYSSGDFYFDADPEQTPYLYGRAFDLHRAAAELWLAKAGKTNMWKGNFAQYAQMQYNFHLAQSWPQQSEVVRT